MDKGVRVRFCPSPTGKLHIGNARVALFNYLFCRHHGGTFIFRIEDTDFQRSTQEYMQNEIDALRWLSLDWDEGIETGGEFGPYKQSERLSIYEKFIDILIKTGKAYYCFCSQDQVDEDRQSTEGEREIYKYSGRCRNLSTEEVRKNLSNNLPYVIRFKIPQNKESIQLIDLIRGEMAFPVSSLDDFILVRSDGVPLYNFAVMIDDATMRITHVIRGEDHLFGNTPRQLLLYEAFGFNAPAFAHLPMILGQDKTKLSKRHGAFSVTDYRDQGFFSEVLVNYMALLGWSSKNDQEIFTLDELIQSFDIKNVNVSPAVFDFEKLKWFNAQFLRKLPGDVICKFVENKIDSNTENLSEIIDLLKNHFTLLTDIPILINKIKSFSGIQDPISVEMKEESTLLMLKLFSQKLRSLELFIPALIQECIKSTGKELNIKGRTLFHPIRLAITNENMGPDIDAVLYVLGKERTLEILNHSIQVLQGGNYGN